MGPTARGFRFLEHPALSILHETVRERLAALEHFPLPSELRELTRGVPRAIAPWFEFTPQQQAELDAAGGFDRFIAKTSRIPTRVGSHHDLLGALIWLHFPALKTAIHRAQLAAEPGVRRASENAATHLDESGVLALSSEPSVFERLAGLHWTRVLWDERAELRRTTRFLGFGHGLLDSLRDPHPKLMGKALFVRVRPEHLTLSTSELRVVVDAELAPRLSTFLVDPTRLQPLPVLGVPGWSAEQSRSFYEDTRYFRTTRQRERPAGAAAFIDLAQA